MHAENKAKIVMGHLIEGIDFLQDSIKCSNTNLGFDWSLYGHADILERYT